MSREIEDSKLIAMAELVRSVAHPDHRFMVIVWPNSETFESHEIKCINQMPNVETIKFLAFLICVLREEKKVPRPSAKK